MDIWQIYNVVSKEPLMSFGVLLLTSFIPLSAIFYYSRLPMQKERYEMLKVPFRVPRFIDYCIDYSFPVAFVTIICFLGHLSLFLGGELITATKPPNLLLSGAGSEDIVAYQKQSLLALTMGFLGAYVWSIQYIFRRFVTNDLLPAAYFSIGIRMILASFVALLAHFFMGVIPIEEVVKEYSKHLTPVMAFFTGMFPLSALHYMQERLKMFSEGIKKSDDLPLDMIEGISILHRIRLSEVGIDNAQNLAERAPIELFKKTPFTLRELIDWIGQAKLYVHLKSEKLNKLRNSPVRTVFDLLLLDDKELSNVAQNAGILESDLSSLCHIIKADVSVQQLLGLKTQLLGLEGQYKAEATST